MEYAQTRMQSRYGARPDEALWRRLGGHQSLDGFLGAARASPLGGYLAGIGDRADAHEIELALRHQWRATVAEVARWMPREWQPAVRWSACLIDLPALAWLAAGGPPQRWMEKDAVLAAHLAAAGGGAAVTAAAPVGRAAWLAAWRRTWPTAADEDAAALERLAAAVESHLADFSQHPAAAPDARRALADTAARWFRRLSWRPAVAFAYLLQVALDLERLRAELVLRALTAELAS